MDRKKPVILTDGDVEESSRNNSNGLGVLVSMVLLSDVFRTITHSSILLDAVAHLLNKEAWPRLRQMLHSADDRVSLIFLCLIDAIIDSGYGKNMMFAFNNDDFVPEESFSSPLYPSVSKQMKLGEIVLQSHHYEQPSTLLDSMIELLLMSPPRPVLTMLSAGALILRLLRERSSSKIKLYKLLMKENVKRIREG